MGGFYNNHMLQQMGFFNKLERLLFVEGVTTIRPGQAATAINTALAKFHNASQPLRAELAQYSARLQSKTQRQGLAWEAISIINPAARQTYMATNGFLPREREAVQNIMDLMQPIHGVRMVPALNQLRGYIAQVNTMFAVGNITNPYRPVMPEQFPDIQHFIAHAEAVQLRLEVPNAARIFDEYIRSYYMAQHVKPTWDAVWSEYSKMGNWKDFRGATPLRPVADLMLGWMKGIERGFQPDQDKLVDGMKSMLGAVGVPVTSQEVSGMYGWGMKQTYRATMGTPKAVIRDSFQFLTAVPMVGAKNVSAAIKELMGNNRSAAFQLALSKGYAELGIPAIVDVPAAESVVDPQIPGAPSPFTARETATREKAQAVSDFFRDMIPPALRETEGTWFDVLKAYTSQGVFFRIVVACAAEKNFLSVHASWVTGKVKNLDRATGMDILEHAERRNINELVQQGRTQAAAEAYAHASADLYMNRYNSKENARGNHSTMGRLGTQLGGFTTFQLRQFYQVGVKGAMEGSPTAFRYLAGMAAIYGATELATKATGWDFSSYNPMNLFNPFKENARGLGGPLAEPMIATAQAAAQVFENPAGQPTRRDEVAFAAMDKAVSRALPLLGGGLTAAAKLANQTGQSLMSTDPSRAIIGQLLVGEKRDPAMIDLNRQIIGWGKQGNGARQ